MAVAELFRALGDPSRLEMMQRLSQAEPCIIGDVCRDLGISRQAARKHLRVLEDAGLVRLVPKGRDVVVHLDAASLQRARAFIGELEQQWDRRLTALKAFVEAE